MQQFRILAAVMFALMNISAVAETSADEQLEAIIAEYWAYQLEADPVLATHLGIDRYNDRLPSVTRDDQLRRLRAEKSFLRQARAVDRSALSSAGRTNAALITWVLEDSIGAYELNLSRVPFNTFSGFYMNALTASDGVLMDDAEDYEKYIARLADIPRYFEENIDNMRDGMRDGFVLPQVVIDSVLPSIRAQFKDDPEDSSFFDPFRAANVGIAAATQERLRAEGRAVIAAAAMPAFAALAKFLADEYTASQTLGAEQMPGGKDYYAFQIRRYTTLLDASAGDIHDTGLAEVSRIRAEMLAIIDDLGFDGSFDAFTEFLLSDPQFYARSEDQLLKEAAYVAKRIDYVMPGYFGKLPRQSYGILPVPDEIAPNYVTGAYYGAPLGGSHGAAFWVNTHALDQRPLYEIPALTLHEAVPGHHHQNALALEMDGVPEFRRSLGFSAFGEGWALYAEKLGVEMGIYRSPYEHFGRLSYEMWRACRLVIDTGIHSRGWSRRQAIDFLRDNTALSAANARAEVDRYISWPGQALAYKLGELRIWSLRRRAQERLGDRFDLRRFHDAVLGHGELPMALLDSVIDEFIDAQLAETRD